MVKRNAIATKLTKRCTQTQKRAFDVAVWCVWFELLGQSPVVNIIIVVWRDC